MAFRIALTSFSTFQRPLATSQQPLARAFATKVLRPTDPNKPKRPLSPYMRFTGAFRERMKGTDMKPKELLAKCGEEWKRLPVNEKTPFENSYKDDMAVYATQMDNYVSSGQKDFWQRDPECPKQPMTAYLQFASELRQKQPQEMKVTEKMRVAGEKWKAMTEADKQPYQQRYAAEKKSYDAAMTEYKASGKQEAWEKKVGIYDLKLKKKEAEDKLKAKKEADAKKAKEKKDKLKAKKEADAKKAKENKEKAKAKKEADAKKAKENKEKAKAKAKKEADAKKAKVLKEKAKAKAKADAKKAKAKAAAAKV